MMMREPIKNALKDTLDKVLDNTGPVKGEFFTDDEIPIPVGLKLTDEEIKTLEQLVEKKGETISWFVTKLVLKAIEKENDRQAMCPAHQNPGMINDMILDSIVFEDGEEQQLWPIV
jgi:hypothetical protein